MLVLCPWRAVLDLLYNPAVAIGVAEAEERAIVAAFGIWPRRLLARLEVEDLAGRHPAISQLGMRGFDVGNDQVQALDGARHCLGDSDPDADRARRARRRQLDDAKLIAGMMVDIHMKAELFAVEGLGAIHIRDRK